MTGRLSADERGVSEVVGAILVFALAIMLLTIMQTQAVPNQNSEVEFQHSLDVQSDLIQFHQIASSVAADGSDRSVSFNMGTGYPSRLLFFNPPRVQGQLETTSNTPPVSITGLQATDGEVGDYISPSKDLDLQTRRLKYIVDYNEHRSDPTTRYEYGVLYNEYESGTVVENEGNIIDDTNINLLFMAGDYSESSTTEDSLSVQGVSAPARSVTITGNNNQNCQNTNNPIGIELTTDLSLAKWQDLYSGSSNVCGIEDVSGKPKIRIKLDPSQTYDLRMSRIGLEPGAASQTPHYIVPVDPGVTSAGVGQSASIEYEVRDRFNNPVSGAEVEFPDGTKEKTNDRGRVSTTVTTSQTNKFTAELQAGNCPGAGDLCKADYRVQVPSLNLNPSSGVRLVNATTGDPDPNTRTGTGGAVDCAVVSCQANVTFKNTNSQKVNIESVRINHYNPDPQGHSDVAIDDNTGNVTTGVEIGGAAVNPSPIMGIKAGKEHTYTFKFGGEVHEGDYFVVTIIYDNNERALYFISPQA